MSVWPVKRNVAPELLDAGEGLRDRLGLLRDPRRYYRSIEDVIEILEAGFDPFEVRFVCFEARFESRYEVLVEDGSALTPLQLAESIAPDRMARQVPPGDKR